MFGGAGVGLNPAAFARTAGQPSAAQQAQTAAQSGVVAGNEFARDKMVKDKRREKMAKMVGSKRSQRKVLDKAGVTKPAAAKKA